MDDFELQLLEYLMALSAPGFVAQFGVIALVAAIAVLAVAVTVVLLVVSGVLRLGAVPRARACGNDSPRPKRSTVRGTAQARAPAIVAEFARA